MKILYVAKHGTHDNQDEDAITYALTKLGHTVICINECEAAKQYKIINYRGIDFVLFHKWEPPERFFRIPHRPPLVFWDFDLVDNPDQTLRGRCNRRISWYSRLIPEIVAGFCTDGDWVAKDTTGKLVHLMQGSDERFSTKPTPESKSIDILFTGSVQHGNSRSSHINELQAHYGDKFHLIGLSGPRGRIHGYELASTLAKTKVTIAPDGPNTDNYWSNRVYLTLGLGGFLIHPFCKKLLLHYSENELTYYHSRLELISLIDFYLENDTLREARRMAGYKATIERNLYRHRCEILIDTVKRRLVM